MLHILKKGNNSTNSMKNKRFINILLMTAILLLAAYLRIYRLDDIPYGLVPDEAIRGYDAYSVWKTGADSYNKAWPLFVRGLDDYTAALYIYLSAPFMGIFGLSALSTRLAAAMAGLLTVALSYQLARRPFGEVAGLSAAFLLAISPCPFIWSI